MYQWCTINFLSHRLLVLHNVRYLSNKTFAAQENLYAVLKITPNASQQQIKSAYYKLSLILHPDKNECSDTAHHKFTKLTEAYKVLGNVNSRRNYDRSMKIEQHALSSPFHNREVIRHKRGKEQKYDMWIRAHYQGTLVQRDDRIKRDTLRQKDDSEEVKGRNLKNVTVFGLLTVAAIVSFCLKKVKERKVYS